MAVRAHELATVLEHKFIKLGKLAFPTIEVFDGKLFHDKVAERPQAKD